MNNITFSETDIPVFNVVEETIAEAYEEAIKQVYMYGKEMTTQYDKENDPPSRDCTLNMTILKPLKDPMIHKAFCGGVEDLREYVFELQGLKDEWVKNINDPQDTRWEYTYHGRLSKYEAKKILCGNNKKISYWSDYERIQVDNKDPVGIDQIEDFIGKLIKTPYTRRAQMITWMPSLDLDCYDPPCLQSIWSRLIEHNNKYYLNTNFRFRSNDAWGASFFNIFGFTQFLLTIAKEIEKRTGKETTLGRINWQADSYHIYGKDLKSCCDRLITKILNGQPFSKRVMDFYNPDIQEMYHECENKILEKIKNKKFE